jgi:hypothetical protein
MPGSSAAAYSSRRSVSGTDHSRASPFPYTRRRLCNNAIQGKQLSDLVDQVVRCRRRKRYLGWLLFFLFLLEMFAAAAPHD